MFIEKRDGMQTQKNRISIFYRGCNPSNLSSEFKAAKIGIITLIDKFHCFKSRLVPFDIR